MARFGFASHDSGPRWPRRQSEMRQVVPEGDLSLPDGRRLGTIPVPAELRRGDVLVQRAWRSDADCWTVYLMLTFNGPIPELQIVVAGDAGEPIGTDVWAVHQAIFPHDSVVTLELPFDDPRYVLMRGQPLI